MMSIRTKKFRFRGSTPSPPNPPPNPRTVEQLAGIAYEGNTPTPSTETSRQDSNNRRRKSSDSEATVAASPAVAMELERKSKNTKKKKSSSQRNHGRRRTTCDGYDDARGAVPPRDDARTRKSHQRRKTDGDRLPTPPHRSKAAARRDQPSAWVAPAPSMHRSRSQDSVQVLMRQQQKQKETSTDRCQERQQQTLHPPSNAQADPLQQKRREFKKKANRSSVHRPQQTSHESARPHQKQKVNRRRSKSIDNCDVRHLMYTDLDQGLRQMQSDFHRRQQQNQHPPRQQREFSETSNGRSDHPPTSRENARQQKPPRGRSNSFADMDIEILGHSFPADDGGPGHSRSVPTAGWLDTGDSYRPQQKPQRRRSKSINDGDFAQLLHTDMDTEFLPGSSFPADHAKPARKTWTSGMVPQRGGSPPASGANPRRAQDLSSKDRRRGDPPQTRPQFSWRPRSNRVRTEEEARVPCPRSERDPQTPVSWHGRKRTTRSVPVGTAFAPPFVDEAGDTSPRFKIDKNRSNNGSPEQYQTQSDRSTAFTLEPPSISSLPKPLPPNNKTSTNNEHNDDDHSLPTLNVKENDIDCMDVLASLTSTVNSAHTAEDLHHLIGMMQVEFLQLRSAKVNAEMRSHTLETSLASAQEERDTDFVRLCMEAERWKRTANEEKLRAAQEIELMRRRSDAAERMEEESARFKLQWSEAVKEKRAMEERVEVLENENCRLKRLLTANAQGSPSHCVQGGEEKASDANRSEDIITDLKERRPHKGSKASSSAAASSLHRFRTPEPPLQPKPMEPSHHHLPQTIHIRHYSHVQHDVSHPPGSWHGGKPRKSGLNRAQIETTAPLARRDEDVGGAEANHTTHALRAVRSKKTQDRCRSSSPHDGLQAPVSCHRGKAKRSLRGAPVEIPPPFAKCNDSGGGRKASTLTSWGNSNFCSTARSSRSNNLQASLRSSTRSLDGMLTMLEDQLLKDGIDEE